jgi:uncharacterized LabA/DUF88 family protein
MNNNKSGVVWLIDAAYVLKGHRGEIDYTRMRRVLQEWAIEERGGRFDQIIFYNSFVEGDHRADNFNKEMERRGFNIKLFPLKRSVGACGCDRVVQRGVDVAICTDLLCMAFEGKFRRVVLSTGDGDLIEAIKIVKSRFQEVWLAGYKDSMSSDLAREAHKVMFL